MSAFDPKRTWASIPCCCSESGSTPINERVNTRGLMYVKQHRTDFTLNVEGCGWPRMGVQVSLPSEPAPEIPQHAQIKLPPDLSIERRQIPYWVETLAAEPKSYSENVQLFSEGQPADHLYKVVKGAVRTFKVLSDGRRHITKFSLAGDFLGIGAGDRHPLSAETVTESKLLIMKCSALAVLAERDLEVCRHLSRLIVSELERAQAHGCLLIMSAKQRVAKFLLEMASRKPKSMKIDLPMSRRDIADYLGLTVETVSRVLGEFEATGAIARQGVEQVLLRNRAKLNRLA